MEKLDKFKLSNYQQRILDEVHSSNNNLLIDAKAGAGKTSTLLVIADELIKQNKKCLFIAFNKHIVEELKRKIDDPNCMIKTVHSLGLSFLKSYLYRKHTDNYELVLDNTRTRTLVKYYFDEICYENFLDAIKDDELTEHDRKQIIYDIVTELINLVDQVRFYNKNYHIPEAITDIAYDKTFLLKNFDAKYRITNYPEVVEAVIDRIKYDFENPVYENGKYIYKVGFTDMIYLPTYYNMYTPRSVQPYLDCVLCDECQDLSILQQNFINLLKGGYSSDRRIFVGDRAQSIYGFAGADCNSIGKLKRKYQTTELPLNICYRCPQNVVRLAQLIVPDIEWNKQREDMGEVKIVNEKFYNNLQPKDVILCRYNKDVLYLYKELVINQNIMVRLKNIDLVNSIINQVKVCCTEFIDRYNHYLNYDRELFSKYKPQSGKCTLENAVKEFGESTITDAIKEIKALQKRTKKPIQKNNFTLNYLELAMEEYLEDGGYDYEPNSDLVQYFAIIQGFIQIYKESSNKLKLNQFIEWLTDLLKGGLDKNLPILSTIHMMKGSEADNIYMYEYPRFPYYPPPSRDTYENRTQEENLMYVGITRAKKNLYLCECSEKRLKCTIKDPEKLKESLLSMEILNNNLEHCIEALYENNDKDKALHYSSLKTDD